MLHTDEKTLRLSLGRIAAREGRDGVVAAGAQRPEGWSWELRWDSCRFGSFIPNSLLISYNYGILLSYRSYQSLPFAPTRTNILKHTHAIMFNPPDRKKPNTHTPEVCLISTRIAYLFLVLQDKVTSVVPLPEEFNQGHLTLVSRKQGIPSPRGREGEGLRGG